MKKYRLLGYFILLSMVCGFGNALMVQQNLSELTLGSDAIIYGKITDVRSQWNSQKTHIETTAQIMVTEVFKKGNNTNISSGSFIPVTILGGTVDNTTESVEGMPFFIPDTMVVVFLGKSSSGPYTLYGLSQGLFPVINGKIGQSKPGKGSPSETDVNTFKQNINEILQSHPDTQIPTTPRAPMIYAPIITAIGILFIFRKHSQ